MKLTFDKCNITNISGPRESAQTKVRMKQE